MKIINIGSSFSAGPGIPPQRLPKAGRSGANYAHLLAGHLNAELTDLSVSGATLLTMLREPQIVRGVTFPPQITGVSGDADLVLVLGGGNDMGYVGGVVGETWLGWLVMRMMALLGGGAAAGIVADEMETCRRYGELLDAVHAKAPRARVIVVEYLTVFGPEGDVKDGGGGADAVCSRQRREYHRGMATKLQRATAKAVSERREWCEILPMAQASETHGLGSQDPWIFGLDLGTIWRGEAWVHPNKRGMEAVAEMLKERLRDGV